MKSAIHPPRVAGLVGVLMLLHGAASLIHFGHNALFIDSYPGLPAWLSSARVWIAWLGVTSLGITGYLLMRFGQRLAGLLIAAIYAALGFDGLAHYSVASFAAHTWAMNLTIWLEVTTAAALVVAIASEILSYAARRQAGVS
jgi:hypothetical protein